MGLVFPVIIDIIGRNQLVLGCFRRLIKFLTSYRPWVDAPSSGAVVIVSLQRVDFGQKARSNPNGNLVFQYCRWVIAWGYLLVLCVYIYSHEKNPGNDHYPLWMKGKDGAPGFSTPPEIRKKSPLVDWCLEGLISSDPSC